MKIISIFLIDFLNREFRKTQLISSFCEYLNSEGFYFSVEREWNEIDRNGLYKLYNLLILLARAGGFEPPTLRSEV